MAPAHQLPKVFNVTFTKDLQRHEAQIRTVWGGALCVSRTPRSHAELMRIQSELASQPAARGISPSPVGTIQLYVSVARESLQRALDAKYGEGVIIQRGTLLPLD